MPTYQKPYRAATIDRVAILVEIQCTYPTTQTFYLSDIPISDTSILANGGTLGVPGIVLQTSLEFGSLDGSEVNIPLLNVIYAHDATDLRTYGRMGDLIARYALHGAPCIIRHYTKAYGVSENSVIWSGYCVNVTDITPSTVTIRANRSVPFERGTVPVWTIGGSGPGTKTWPYAMADLPDMSKGMDIPLRLGPPYWIPRGLSGWYTNSLLQDATPYFGSTTILPARLAKDARGQATPLLVWASQERPYGGVDGYGALGYGLDPVLYSTGPDDGVVGVLNRATGTGTDADATTLGFYNPQSTHPRKVTYFIVPDEVASSSPAGLDGKKCTDRKHTTWLTLESSQSIQFKIPRKSIPGIITAANTYISVQALTLANNPGGGSATGTFKMGIVEPGSSTYFPKGALTMDALNCSVTGIRTGTASGGSDYPGSAYWNGTRWQAGDFTASGESDGGNVENLVYVNGSEGEPFEIRIETQAASRLHLVGVWLKVIYVEGEQKIPRYVKNPQRPGIAFVEARPKRALWGRRPVRPKVELGPVDPEGVYVHHPGYWDSGGTFGGGTSRWIESPGAMCQYLAYNYTRPQHTFTVGSVGSTGVVKHFDSIMDAWANLHYTGGELFKLFYWCHERTSALEAIEDILSECPGGARTGILGDGTPALIAQSFRAPSTSGSESGKDNWQMDVKNAGGLHPDIDLYGSGDQGIEVVLSDLEDVVNDLEIHYQYNPVSRKYGAVARCNKNSSDDGFGRSWPAAPTTGKSAAQICSDSETIYGHRKKLVIHLQYHWYPETAIAYGCWILWRRWRSFATVRCVGTLALHGLVPGRVISFSNTLRSRLNMACPVPFSHQGAGYVTSWTDRPWWITNLRRIDVPAGNHYHTVHELICEEHLNNTVGLSGGGLLHGGPGLGTEGFDQ